MLCTLLEPFRLYHLRSFLYLQSSIISGTGQKLSLGLLTTITLEVVPFCAYVPFLALLPLFKFILEVLFCEGVHTA
jgi:hypothetical protein